MDLHISKITLYDKYFYIKTLEKLLNIPNKKNNKTI